jgi:hypothetical protein
LGLNADLTDGAIKQMSRGKYLSLPEARKKRKLDQFAKEHPSEGDAQQLERVIRDMATKTPESERQTTPKENDHED